MEPMIWPSQGRGPLPLWLGSGPRTWSWAGSVLLAFFCASLGHDSSTWREQRAVSH